MSAGADTPPRNTIPAYQGNGERSLGQLFSAATADLSSLLHDEIALAKAEIRQDVKRSVVGGASLGVGAVVGLAAIPMLSFAAVYGIHALGPALGFAFLYLGLFYLVVAIILGLLARRFFKKVEKPQRTIEGARATGEVLMKAKPRAATADERAALTTAEEHYTALER